jgi:hypothetical protein
MTSRFEYPDELEVKITAEVQEPLLFEDATMQKEFSEIKSVFRRKKSLVVTVRSRFDIDIVAEIFSSHPYERDKTHYTMKTGSLSYKAPYKIMCLFTIPKHDVQKFHSEVLENNPDFEISLEEYRYHHYENIVDTCLKRLRQFICLVNINYFGAIQVRHFELRGNGKLIRKDKGVMADFLISALTHAKAIGWKLEDRFDVFEVWRKIVGSSWIVDEFSVDPVSRAFNCFSYITREESSLEETLVWAMLGLEALYSRSTSGIMEQLREKIEVLFGSEANLRRRISGLYAFRSSFLHGTTDIPFHNTNYETLDRFEKYEKEVYDSCSFALLILCQTMIYIFRTWNTDFDFKYKLQNGGAW